MKFWEVLAKQTKKGVKIKRTHQNFSSTNEQGFSFVSSPLYIDDINADDWELYEEPVKTYTFMEALELMKNGAKMTRPTWIQGSYVEFNVYGFAIKHGDPRMWVIDDFEEKDWTIVENV